MIPLQVSIFPKAANSAGDACAQLQDQSPGCTQGRNAGPDVVVNHIYIHHLLLPSYRAEHMSARREPDAQPAVHQGPAS